MIRTRKRSKRSRERGSRTRYWGGRKKHKGTGMRGGAGMSGTGKKSGQKITWVQKNMTFKIKTREQATIIKGINNGTTGK